MRPDPLTAAIGVARNTELRQVLERLEIALEPRKNTDLRTPRGLGFNNILFMATEFLLLADDAVREWWTAHLEADRKGQEELRRKREAAAAKAVKTRKRNELIARLTSEERELLGVKIKT